MNLFSARLYVHYYFNEEISLLEPFQCNAMFCPSEVIMQ
jgi:hypothetical protein